MKLTSIFLCVVCAIVTAMPITNGIAAEPYKSAADIPVEVFFKRVDYRDLRLSPDGKTLAAVVPIKNRGNLVLIDIASRKLQVVTSSTSNIYQN